MRYTEPSALRRKGVIPNRHSHRLNRGTEGPALLI
jgi:hypothetical protein